MYKTVFLSISLSFMFTLQNRNLFVSFDVEFEDARHAEV